MKLKRFALGAITLSVLLFSCKQKKERLDDIVKDLSPDSYALHFDKPYPAQGITKTEYGMESYLVYADPQDLICGDRLGGKYKGPGVPVFRLPKSVRPITCPDYGPIDIAGNIRDLLIRANARLYSGKDIKIGQNKVLFGNEQLTRQYAGLTLDSMDAAFAGLDESKFTLLFPYDNLGAGATRYFYGTAKQDSLFTKYPPSDIFHPRMTGCYDPKILLALRDRLISMNSNAYGQLQVKPLRQDAAKAVLQY